MADVLIVDDDPALRELLTLMVEQLGHAVRVAPTAEAALVASAEARPDLLLLDLSLPGRDGDELVELLQRGFGRPRSMIVVSARPHHAVHAVADRFGARHLHKPFAMDDFMAAVTEALDEVVAALASLPPGLGAVRAIAGDDWDGEIVEMDSDDSALGADGAGDDVGWGRQ